MLLIEKLIFLTIPVFVLGYVNQANCPFINSRLSWNAKSPKSVTHLKKTPQYVVIHHSDTPGCGTADKCAERVLNIQNYHMNTRNWADIGYNFLVGSEGQIYEGRGWGIQGSHHPKYNNQSIGICLIGTFKDELPSNSQLKEVKNLISCAQYERKIAQDYHLIGHRQGRTTDCPGDALFEDMKVARYTFCEIYVLTEKKDFKCT